MKDNIRSAIKELVIDLKGDDVTEKIVEKWLINNKDILFEYTLGLRCNERAIYEKRKDRKSNI